MVTYLSGDNANESRAKYIPAYKVPDDVTSAGYRKVRLYIMDQKKQVEELSKSKAKRIERQKEVAMKKKKKTATRIIWGVVIAAVVVVVGVFAGLSIYRASKITASNANYSAGLLADGLIENVNVSECVKLADYENHIIPLDEVKATDEEIEQSINSTLNSHKELSEDTSLEVVDGDKVNIDFVGTVDGVEFEGGSTNGEGSDRVIGSGSFVDDFEQQLIGAHPGDKCLVNVTFPEDYSNEELSGKDAQFDVTVNGIYVTPEFTDEFVAAYLSEQASSAEEYRQQLEDQFYQSHLQDYIAAYIIDGSEVITYPKSYVKALKGVIKYNDEYQLSYYNNMFSAYGISYNNVWELREGIEDEMAYEEELTQRAMDSAKSAMVYQAIAQKQGFTADFDAYVAELTEASGEDYATQMQEYYGKGYMCQTKLAEMVMDYLMETAVVE